MAVDGIHTAHRQQGPVLLIYSAPPFRIFALSQEGSRSAQNHHKEQLFLLRRSLHPRTFEPIIIPALT